jgi:hypothetical protein
MSTRFGSPYIVATNTAPSQAKFATNKQTKERIYMTNPFRKVYTRTIFWISYHYRREREQHKLKEYEIEETGQTEINVNLLSAVEREECEKAIYT